MTSGPAPAGHRSPHVCPPWIGYLLASPLRRWIHNPDRILAPHVAAGMTVLDVGPAMGFFTLPMARRVGPGGRIVCVDVQEAMLRALRRRAEAAGLADRIVTRVCTADALGIDDLDGRIDFALAFAVIHEMPDASIFFANLARALKPDARCLVAEPKGHVIARKFEATLTLARQQAFRVLPASSIPLCHAALLQR